MTDEVAKSEMTKNGPAKQGGLEVFYTFITSHSRCGGYKKWREEEQNMPQSISSPSTKSLAEEEVPSTMKRRGEMVALHFHSNGSK